MKFLVSENTEAECLNLRQFIEEDWKDAHAHYSDKNATEFTFGRSLTEGESKALWGCE